MYLGEGRRYTAFREGWFSGCVHFVKVKLTITRGHDERIAKRLETTKGTLYTEREGGSGGAASLPARGPPLGSAVHEHRCIGIISSQFPKQRF